jgi:methylmalonyl-CoA/ethylmalonyl-CoA epimerase
MKVERVDHISIAVRNLEEAVRRWEEMLGIHVTNRYRDEEGEKINVAQFQLGETIIELMEPTSPDSEVQKFLDRRGEGIMVLSLRVDDVAQALRELREKGAPVIDNEPRRLGQVQFGFVHPKGFNGVLLELISGP